MPRNDVKSSVSHRYAVFFAVAAFLLIAAYVSYETYGEHERQTIRQMETESTRIDRALIIEIEHSSHLLQAIGQQVARMEPDNLNAIAVLLRSFDTTATVHHVFSWIDADGNNVVSTNKGVHKPVDVSDRDFVKKATATPWKIVVGNPIQGRVSGKWALPVALGITDATGKYMGTLLISMDIYTITGDLQRAVKGSGISFIAYSSKDISPLTQNTGDERLTQLDSYSGRLKSLDLHDHASGVLARSNPFDTASMSVYYESSSYPYVILLGMDNAASNSGFMALLAPRLLEIMLLGFIIITLLWLVRLRIIEPIAGLTDVTGGLLRGEAYYDPTEKSGIEELSALASQIKKLSDYLRELRLAEEERKNKNIMLKSSKEASELGNRIKLEFLKSMSHELRTPLNTILGFAELMKTTPLNPRQYQQYSEDIHRAAKQLQGLVGDMQKLPRLETNASDMQEKHIDVRFIVSKALRILATKLAENKLNVELKFPEDPMPHILMDESWLEQIIMAIIVYITGGNLSESHVVIRAYEDKESKENEYFCISFTDSRHSASHVAAPEKTPVKLENFIGIPLTRALAAMYQIEFEAKAGTGKPVAVALKFPKARLVY